MSENLQKGGEPSTEQTGGAVPDQQTGDKGSAVQSAGESKWYDVLADEGLKGNEVLKGYGSVEDLAKAHVETLGKLAVPEDYDIQVPEGHPVNPAVIEAAKGWFKNAALTAEQAQKVASDFIALEQQMMVDYQKQEEAELSALRKEYGSQWEAEFSLASKTFSRFSTEEEAKAFEKSGLGNNALLIRWLNRIGKNISEGTFVEGAIGVRPQKSLAEKIYGVVSKQ